MTDELGEDELREIHGLAIRELARRVRDEPEQMKAHELIRAAEVLERQIPKGERPTERKQTVPDLSGLPEGRARELQPSSEPEATVATND